MPLKTATLIALIATAIYAFLELLVFFMPIFRYGFQNGPIGQIIEFAFPASVTLFFFALYSKQNKS